MTKNVAPMRYSEFETAPELKPWVAAYWTFEVETEAGEIEHWIPPTGGAILAFPRGAPAVLVGPRIVPHRTFVRGGDLLWGVHFWPGAGSSFLGLDLGTLRDQQLPMAGICPVDWTAPLSEALTTVASEVDAADLLDRHLVERIAHAAPLDEKALTAVFRLLAANGQLRIDGLAEGLDLSARQLRRRVRRAAGLTLKELARIQRTRASAATLTSSLGRRWVDLAAERGFSDQAHLIREFRKILGLTPNALRDHLDRIEHGRLLR